MKQAPVRLVQLLVILGLTFTTPSWKAVYAASDRLHLGACVDSAAGWWQEQEDVFSSYDAVEVRWIIPLCRAAVDEGVADDAWYAGRFVVPQLALLLEGQNIAVRRDDALYALRLMRQEADVDPFIEQLRESHVDRAIGRGSLDQSMDIDYAGEAVAFLDFTDLVEELDVDVSWARAILAEAIRISNGLATAPGGSRENLEPLLQDPRPGDASPGSSSARAQSILMLADTGERSAAEQMMNFLRDDDPEARVSAVEGLFRLGEVPDVAVLRDLLGEPGSPVSRAALETLVLLGHSVDEQLLLDLLLESPDAGKLAGGFSAGGPGEGDNYLSGRFRDIVDAMSTRPELGIVPELIDNLKSEDASTAARAARALRRIGGPEVLRPVLDHYGNDGRQAGSAIDEMGHTVADELIRMYENGELNTGLAVNSVGVLTRFHRDKAVAVLEGLVESGDTEARAWGAAGLAVLGDARAVGPLLSLLDEEEWRHREGEVVALLQNVDDARVHDRVIELLVSDDFDVRFDVLWVLAQVGAPWAIKPLSDLLRSDDGNVRERAAHALGELGGHEARTALLELIPDESVREALDTEKAVEKLQDWVVEAVCDLDAGLQRGSFAGLESLEPLERLLAQRAIQGRNPPTATIEAVRAGVAELVNRWAGIREAFRDHYVRSGRSLEMGVALDWVLSDEHTSCFKDARSVVRPVASLVDDTVLRARVEAATTLFKLGTYRPLLSLRISKDFATRHYADANLEHLEGTGEWDLPPGIDPLLELVDQIEGSGESGTGFTEDERTAIRESLLKLLDPNEAYPAVLGLLTMDRSEIRRAAMRALGDLGDRRAVVPLIERLNDEEAFLEAVDALGALGDPRAVPPLVDLLSEYRLELIGTKDRIVKALGELRDPRAVEPILTFLDEEHDYYRRLNRSNEIVEAIRKIGDRSAIEPLNSLLVRTRDLEEHERATIVSALFALGDPGAVGPFRQLLDEDEVAVRSIAENALLGHMENVPVDALARLADAESPTARANLAAALGRKGENEAIPPLVNLLGGDDHNVRFASAESLGRLGGPRAYSALVEHVEPNEWFEGKLFEILDRSERDDENALIEVATVRYLNSLLSEASNRGVFSPKLVTLVKSVGERAAYRPRLDLLEEIWQYRYLENQLPETERRMNAERLDAYLSRMEDPGPFGWLFAALTAGNAGLHGRAAEWAEKGLSESRGGDAGLRLTLAVVIAEGLSAQGMTREGRDVISAVEREDHWRLTPLEKIGRHSLLEAEFMMTKAFLDSKLGSRQETIVASYEAETILKNAVRLTWITTDLYERLRARRIAPILQHNLALEHETFLPIAVRGRDAEPRGVQEAYARMLMLGIEIEEARRTQDIEKYIQVHKEVERLALERIAKPREVKFSDPDRQKSVELLEELQKELEDLEKDLSNVLDDGTEVAEQERQTLRARVRKKKGQLISFILELKRKRPAIAAMWAKSPTDVAQLSAHLDENTAIVQFLVLDEMSYAFVIRHNSLVEIEELSVAGERCVRAEEDGECLDSLKGLVTEYRALLALASPSQPRVERRDEVGKVLANALLEPIARHIAELSYLILVPNNELHRLPFGALPWNDGYLVQDKVLTLLPAGSLIGALVAGPQSGPAGLLAFGNSIPETSMRELKSAEKEVKDLENYFPDLPREDFRILTNEDAHRKELVGPQLESFVLHFAVHAESGSVETTRLHLTGGDVTYKDVVGLNISNSPMVVLSACETGLGERLSGDEVYSLANAFLLALARSVVFSLWLVNDPATQVLMREFYGGIQQGAGVSLALAEAKRSLIGKGYEPFYWAGFVVSEWTGSASNHSTSGT